MDLLKVGTSGKVKKPFMMGLYSDPGIGKTDFANSFPKPYFFDFEESSHNIDVRRYRPTSWLDLINGLTHFYNKKAPQDEVKTFVFDTCDELQRLIFDDVAKAKGRDSIWDIGFQRGFIYAVDRWSELLHLCRLIRNKHQINFLFLAHSSALNTEDLEHDVTFKKVTMALEKKSANYLFGQLEMVLYAKKKVTYKKYQDQIYIKDHGKRILLTSASAQYDAKNRIGLPPELEMPYKQGYQVLRAAYDKAFGETNDQVLGECKALINDIEDEVLRDKMSSFCQDNKDDITRLRHALSVIKKRIEEQAQEVVEDETITEVQDQQ